MTVTLLSLPRRGAFEGTRKLSGLVSVRFLNFRFKKDDLGEASSLGKGA